MAANQDQQFLFLPSFPCFLVSAIPVILSHSLSLYCISLSFIRISRPLSLIPHFPLFPNLFHVNLFLFLSLPLPRSPLLSSAFLFFSSSFFCLSFISHIFPKPSSLPPYFPFLSSFIHLFYSLYRALHFICFTSCYFYHCLPAYCPARWIRRKLVHSNSLYQRDRRGGFYRNRCPPSCESLSKILRHRVVDNSGTNCQCGNEIHRAVGIGKCGVIVLATRDLKVFFAKVSNSAERLLRRCQYRGAFAAPLPA